MFGRSLVVSIYEDFFHRNSQVQNRIRTIAVVSGTLSEPELRIFHNQAGVKIDFFGIAENENYMDLNFPPAKRLPKYDLVLCNQVLEHVWNLNFAIDNLLSLLNHQGLIFLSVPASNKKHGLSDDFFSAGYQPQFFVNMLKERGVECILSGDLGSERLYNMTHRQQVWPTIEQHNKPLVGNFRKELLISPREFLKFLFRALEACLWSPEVRHGTQFSTETYILCKKGKR